MPAYEANHDYFDAHTHLRRETRGFFSMLSASRMAVAASVSWPFVLPASVLGQFDPHRIVLTVGIHPWDAGKAELSALERIIGLARRDGGAGAQPGAIGEHDKTEQGNRDPQALPDAPEERRRSIWSAIRALGEIGMDSVWCDVPLDIQRRQFCAQLDLAEKTGLPVVLHTKGCEEEIAALIRPYSGPFLVHWYSCPTIFAGYREKDCFFTVGPDVATNSAVQAVARTIPADRLMVETDGRDAVAWATGKRITTAQLSAVLDSTIAHIATAQSLPAPEVRRLVVKNACSFYGMDATDTQALWASD